MNAPTLLVGLGGTGSDIVQKVFERATPRQRENIGFVIFDTDVNELRVIEEKTPQIRTVQTSTRLTVGEYLDVDTYSRDNWFPVNRILNGKALTEGAGQVRAVSRLALNTAIQQGKMAPLNEAIEELYKLKGQKTVQAPRVILAGSLCGGTGSGLILPVALYINEIVGDTLYTHIEKADRQYKGAYQMLVNQAAITFAVDEVSFINREEDMGDLGLRTSKKSYHPIELLKKYTIEVG